MGDNGAGKSTLVKIIAGNFPPSEGEIRIDGKAVHFHKPVDARAEGIEVVYQDLALVRQLDRGRERLPRPRAQAVARPLQDHRLPAMYARAAELFAELKSETRPRDLVKQMSGGQRQAVAIARTRLSDAKLVLMDEPTAAISVRQVAEVLDLIQRLKHQGVAVMLISHRMPDVFAVCDRVVVMRRGTQGGRQGDRRHLAGGGHRPHHRRHPRRLSPEPRHVDPPRPAHRRRDRGGHQPPRAQLPPGRHRQPAVLGHGGAAHHLPGDELAAAGRLRRRPTTCSTSPATSPSSASWRWA